MDGGLGYYDYHEFGGVAGGTCGASGVGGLEIRVPLRRQYGKAAQELGMVAYLAGCDLVLFYIAVADVGLLTCGVRDVLMEGMVRAQEDVGLRPSCDNFVPVWPLLPVWWEAGA